MKFVEGRLYKINPGYLSEYEDLIKRHAQFGGGADEEKYIGSKAFSNVYEFYVYAFFLGLARDLKIEITVEDKVKTFWEMENWKPKELIDYLLACAISESDFDMIGVEMMEENDIRDEMMKLKRTIEGYANGGFDYIAKELASDPALVENDLYFVQQLASSRT